MLKLKEIIDRLFRAKKSSGDVREDDIQVIQSMCRDVTFSFREGFADRIISRINHLQETDPMEIYYKVLSNLLPRILGVSVAAIILIGLILFAIHGSISPEKLLGADKINDSNFISYLFLE